MTAILVVRHASAGDRSAWAGDDAQRPLDERGRRQARRLAELLSARDVGRILTSPSLRCVETVEPLAVLLDLPAEQDTRLAEGTGGAVHELVRSLEGADADVVMCSHGDVIGELIGYGRPSKKGSVWVLERADDGAWEPTEYLKPSKEAR